MCVCSGSWNTGVLDTLRCRFLAADLNDQYPDVGSSRPTVCVTLVLLRIGSRNYVAPRLDDFPGNQEQQYDPSDNHAHDR
jgi:hypothetical protein